MKLKDWRQSRETKKQNKFLQQIADGSQTGQMIAWRNSQERNTSVAKRDGERVYHYAV